MVEIYISKSGHILLMRINKEDTKWGKPQPAPWQPCSKWAPAAASVQTTGGGGFLPRHSPAQDQIETDLTVGAAARPDVFSTSLKAFPAIHS